MDQQLQFEHGELAPLRVLVEVDADQRGDVGVFVQLVVLEAIQQIGQRVVVQAMQVQDVLTEQQRLVGVVPDQVLDRIHFRIAGHEDAAGGGAQLVVHGDVHFLVELGEQAEQRGRFLGIGVLTLRAEIPVDEVEIRFRAEEAPRDHAAGIDEVLDEVVRFGDGFARERRLRQVVQAFETAALQQFGQAALQRDLEARMRAERRKYAARARVHQGHAHHRILAAQRRVLDQHREALLFQSLDAGHDARVARQHVLRHVRQRQFAFEDLALDRALEDLGQALHLGFRQRIAGAHAIAGVQVFDQVRREVHDLAVRLARVRQRDDPARDVAGIGVDQVRRAQLAVGVVDGAGMVVEDPVRQRIVRSRLEPALVRIMHERRVGDVLAPVHARIEMVVADALDVLAQRRRQRAFLGRALAVGEAHRRMRVADVQRPDVGDDVAPRRDLDLDAQPRQQPRHVGDGLFQRQVLARDAGARPGVGLQGQQRLRVGIEVLDFLDHEFRPGLHHLLDRAAVDRAQDALAVLVRDIRRQLDLDLEDLLVAVFRIDDIVLREADILGRNIARVAVQLHEVGRAQGRRGQKIIERAGRRTVALVADGLVGDYREVVEPGFETQLVEEVDLDFHEGVPNEEMNGALAGPAPPPRKCGRSGQARSRIDERQDACVKAPFYRTGAAPGRGWVASAAPRHRC